MSAMTVCVVCVYVCVGAVASLTCLPMTKQAPPATTPTAAKEPPSLHLSLSLPPALPTYEWSSMASHGVALSISLPPSFPTYLRIWRRTALPFPSLALPPFLLPPLPAPHFSVTQQSKLGASVTQQKQPINPKRACADCRVSFFVGLVHT